MADIPNMSYEFDADGILRLQKDLNYMFSHLDHQNVTHLYTNHCNIQSKDGETQIDGPQLIMKDSSSVTRLTAGLNTASNEFEFNLYDGAGAPTLTLNSSGEAVFGGVVNTSGDLYVGGKIFVGWGGSTLRPTASFDARSIILLEEGTTNYIGSLSIYNSGTSNYDLITFSSQSMFTNSRGRWVAYSYAQWRQESTASMNTSDRMELYSFNNRMFINVNNASTSTALGTFIGRNYHDVYLGNDKYWYDKVMSLRDQEFSAKESYLRVSYSHNIIVVPIPTSDWPGSGGYSTNTTIRMASTYNMYYYNSTNNAYFIGAASTFASMDMSQFHDGTAVTTDDYIVLVTYNEHVTGSSNHHMAFYLGNTSDDNYYWYVDSSNFSTGWNKVKLKIGTAAVQGVPSWNNVDYARYNLIMSSGTSGLGGVFDYTAIVRADANDGSSYNVYQRLSSDGTEENITNSYVGSLLGTHSGEPVICQTPIYETNSFDTWIRSGVQDFIIEADFYSLSSNTGPSLAAYYDADNYAILRLSSGVLRLYGYKNGSTWGNYINCAGFGHFTEGRMRMQHNVDFWKGQFWVDGEAETFREVQYAQGPTTGLEYAHIYLGNSELGKGSKIEDVRIKGINF